MNETSKVTNEEVEQRAMISSAGALKENEELVKISGSGNISGGTISKFVKVSGSGKIAGNLKCHGIKTSGSLKGEGNLTSLGSVKSSGSFGLEGGLVSESSAKFSGSARVGQDANILGPVKSSGSFKVGGDLSGGNDVKFSGSAKIEGEAAVQGFTKASGSLKVGKNLQSNEGLKASGSVGVGGNLLSQRDVTVRGAANVNGNLVGENVLLGFTGWRKWVNMRPFARKYLYKVGGSLFAKDKVDVRRISVSGDVKGYDVYIGRQSEVSGKIYFVNSLKIKRSVKLTGEPIQISAEELQM
jgi:predicted acyltransferase (DUF342 family)